MENNGKPGDHSNGVVVVRPAAEIMSRQQLPYYVGISEVTAGAKNISMNLIIIPPGGSAEPHLHKGYEAAIYLLKGRVATRYGKKLENSVICEAGRFRLYQGRRAAPTYQSWRHRTGNGSGRTQ